MPLDFQQTKTITLDSPCIPKDITVQDEPVVLKGFVKQWPMVEAGIAGLQDACDYLRQYYNGKLVSAFYGSPDMQGRFFYNDTMDGFNFDAEFSDLNDVLARISDYENDDNSPFAYVGSTTVDACFPGLLPNNPLEIEGVANPLISIWLGNRSRIACHYDAPDNIAICVSGRRRFTMFPPSQIENLYPGPVDLTPAGQVISMVDFMHPDFERFPRFKDAIEAGQVADLEPGDALFLPSMWWHQVEAFEALNILVNYWWRPVPAHMGPGVNALKHAMLSIRDLPEKERQAWKAIFDYYIFGDQNKTREHLPESAQGVLSSIDSIQARKIRAFLLNKLNR